MKLSKMMFVASTLLVLASATSVAQANTDRKIHPASMCQPERASQDGNNLRYYPGNIENAGREDIKVVCPIVRDNTQNNSGTRLAYAWVRSRNGRSLSCTLSSRYSYGTEITYRTRSTTSSGASRLNLDVNSSAVLGFYVISCTLPPGGKMYSYDIDEW